MKNALTERALIARINRKLAHEDQLLRKARPGSRWIGTTGEFWVVDVSRNTILDMHVDPEALAVELGIALTSDR